MFDAHILFISGFDISCADDIINFALIQRISVENITEFLLLIDCTIRFMNTKFTAGSAKITSAAIPDIVFIWIMGCFDKIIDRLFISTGFIELPILRHMCGSAEFRSTTFRATVARTFFFCFRVSNANFSHNISLLKFNNLFCQCRYFYLRKPPLL